MLKSAARHAEAELMTETVDPNVQLSYVLVSRATHARARTQARTLCQREKLVTTPNVEGKKKKNWSLHFYCLSARKHPPKRMETNLMDHKSIHRRRCSQCSLAFVLPPHLGLTPPSAAVALTQPLASSFFPSALEISFFNVHNRLKRN